MGGRLKTGFRTFKTSATFTTEPPSKVNGNQAQDWCHLKVEGLRDNVTLAFRNAQKGSGFDFFSLNAVDFSLVNVKARGKPVALANRVAANARVEAAVAAVFEGFVSVCRVQKGVLHISCRTPKDQVERISELGRGLAAAIDAV